MVMSANSGLFSSLGSNQSKLNTRKQKDFMWGAIPRRLANNKKKVGTQKVSLKEQRRFKHWLEETKAMDRQRDIYSLTVSVLLTLLLAVAIF